MDAFTPEQREVHLARVRADNARLRDVGEKVRLNGADAMLSGLHVQLKSPPKNVAPHQRAFMRLGACADDVAGHARALEVLCIKETEGFHRLFDEVAKKPAGDDSADPDTRGVGLFQAMKAMHFFVRSFQDAACAALQSLLGDPPGTGTSMSDALKNPNNAVHKMITAELPAYRAWFTSHRDVRNAFKLGLATWSGIRFLEGCEIFAVQIPKLTKMEDGSEQLSAGWEMTIKDICIDLQWCVDLLLLVKREAEKRLPPPGEDPSLS